MRNFDYSFLKNSLLPTNLLGITNSIAERKALDQIRKRNFQNIFTKLERLKTQNISKSVQNILYKNPTLQRFLLYWLFG